LKGAASVTASVALGAMGGVDRGSAVHRHERSATQDARHGA
jgi:hypothetical protein